MAWFVVCVATLAFGYGYASARFQLFPDGVIASAQHSLRGFTERPPYLSPAGPEQTRRVTRTLPTATDGLNLVVAVTGAEQLGVSVVDMSGEILHEWKPDWFDIWPDPQHLPARAVPKSRPGTHIHGALIDSEGNLYFNFDFLGMVKLDVCGSVVWRLPRRTHHSIYEDGDGFWVPAIQTHEQPLAWLPGYLAPVTEPLVLRVSKSGEVTREISVLELLRDNGLTGLLFMNASESVDNSVSGDRLHLNDVEIFPETLQPGFFSPGDLMISLRNVNAVLVFEPKELRLKRMFFGGFVRQHDPDFVDGNTISVFDNNSVGEAAGAASSRIVLLSAQGERSTVAFQGTEEHAFYSGYLGKHQWLPNGHLLITESGKGRAFEVTRGGELVWEFNNLLEDGSVGWLEEVTRLPFDLREQILSARTAHSCASP